MTCSNLNLYYIILYYIILYYIILYYIILYYIIIVLKMLYYKEGDPYKWMIRYDLLKS